MNDPVATDILGIGTVILGFLLLIVTVMWIIFPVVTYYQIRGLDDTLRALGRELGDIKAHLKDAMPDARVTVPCGICNGSVRYHQRQSGTSIRCPHCGKEIILP